ncbi:MAG: LysM peptidoglycan-binding domain-containing protein [Patescibacteria group bacterium]|nr:LysM peptidoglycan-binding domain-containing protein [Patescibacteria group bacterium]
MLRKEALSDAMKKTPAENAWHEWLHRTINSLRFTETKILSFIKNNRTCLLLEFFRKYSAVLVVVFVTLLVVAGNTAQGIVGEEEGFLVGVFEKETTNEEKIIRRVKNNTYKHNLASAPLATANEQITNEGGSIAEFIPKDGNLNQNQMQYQVLTATTPDARELLDQGADVAVYEVKDGDTVGSIAKDFNVTVNTILWANDIADQNMIMPGDKIFILPVTGVKYTVKEGDQIDKIAKKYKTDKDKIIVFNELSADGAIEIGMELVIPDGQIEQPQPATPSNLLRQRNYYGSGVAAGDSSAKRAPSIIDRNPKGGHKFPYGYCTWYVSRHKHVPWGGNAGTWLYHARAYGAKTGKKPKKGAIIVTSESWYGHVGIVTKVKGSKVTISEMNYRGFAKVSSRTISAKSRAIKGYIY